MKKFLLFLVIAFSGILFACNKDNDDNRNQVEIRKVILCSGQTNLMDLI